MSAGIGLRLLLLACLAPRPALGQGCSAEKEENAIVDISFALPAGIRGAEPVYASAPEACMRACCLGKGLPGKGPPLPFSVTACEQLGNYFAVLPGFT